MLLLCSDQMTIVAAVRMTILHALIIILTFTTYIAYNLNDDLYQNFASLFVCDLMHAADIVAHCALTLFQVCVMS